MASVPRIFLWLFVINLGIAFGAGLCETRIEFPRWLSRTAGTGYDGTGYQWNAAAAREANTGLRFWVAVALARQWGQLNYVRHARVLVAWLAALNVLSRS